MCNEEHDVWRATMHLGNVFVALGLYIGRRLVREHTQCNWKRVYVNLTSSIVHTEKLM